MDSDSIYKEQVNQIGPRVVGTIVLVCSLSMLSMAWKRRDRLFHRLVLGKSSLKSKEEEEEEEEENDAMYVPPSNLYSIICTPIRTNAKEKLFRFFSFFFDSYHHHHHHRHRHRHRHH